MSLPVSESARRRFGLDELVHGEGGKLTLESPVEAREAAARIARHRQAGTEDPPLGGGELNALALLSSILEALLRQYVVGHPGVIAHALRQLDRFLGAPRVDRTLEAFRKSFRSSSTSALTLADNSNLREGLLIDLLLLWLVNRNPAARPAAVLFDDRQLAEATDYNRILELLTAFFAALPGLEVDGPDLLTSLTQPARAAPDSLSQQLRMLQERWGAWLGDYEVSIVIGLGVLSEDAAPRLPPGPGPVEAPGFGEIAEEIAFSADRAWMPAAVLQAKNVYVWLHQLARRYRRPIDRLDQIPGEELDRLAKQGMTGLWLIGIWARSPASQRIKELTGQRGAAASAYSIFEYRVAAALGGDGAATELQERAAQRGIRLAADMVPNHMGLDSRWVVDHPEWFLSVDRSPYPAYTFDGPDLSSDPRVGIFLEDHYYDRSDAAVVFRHVDRRSGRERFIYHGNDGTSTPWNDTAQIDYLNPQARTAVLETILRVAQRFPIVRFDAAMTLARKHIQRLWFPLPGDEGAIPSRAEHGKAPADFDRAMPNEFWRQVVDEAKSRAPDTLLLAEAFWLMEGFFVRTLGMHRVYNSAFMNMLRERENRAFRDLLRELVSFDSRILERFVNFMSNPDEETAREQFGDEDRYFGVCTLLATLPGLPLFAHGQFEGLEERYGMEYIRPRLEEPIDAALLARHERQISPLLRRRGLYADSRHFLLLDLEAADGKVEEDVLAYVNGPPGGRILVAFNNSDRNVSGWIRKATRLPTEEGAGKPETKSAFESLGLSSSLDRFVRFRELVEELDYLFEGPAIARSGFRLELAPFGCRLFSEFEGLEDSAGVYAIIADQLHGQGVADLDVEVERLRTDPLELALERLTAPGFIRRLRAAAAAPGHGIDRPFLAAVERRIEALVSEAERRGGGLAAPAESIVSRAMRRVRLTLDLPAVQPASTTYPGVPAALRHLQGVLRGHSSMLEGLFLSAVVRTLDEVTSAGSSAPPLPAPAVHKAMTSGLAELVGSEARASRLVGLLEVAASEKWGGEARRPGSGVEVRAWLRRPELERFVELTRARGVEWLRRGSFKELLDWRLAFAALAEGESAEVALVEWWEAVKELRVKAEKPSKPTPPAQGRATESS